MPCPEEPPPLEEPPPEDAELKVSPPKFVEKDASECT